MPGSFSISAFSSASFSESSASSAAARAPASLACRPSSAFSSVVASLNRALTALRSARSPSISVLAARTSASSASSAWRSRSTPLSRIARSTVSRFALTKSNASIAPAYRKLVEVQPAVPAAEIEQGIEPRVEACLHHLADQDMVVAPVVHGMAPAFEHAERLFEDRRARLAARPGRGAEAVLVAGRKADRGRLLPGLKHVHREVRGLDQRVCARCLLGQAHQQ